VRDAIEILRKYHVSQMPVVKAEPPIMAGEVAGSVSERDLLEAVFTGKAGLADPVERHMAQALPLVGGGEPVDAARRALEFADAVMVVIDGRPTGVLTRHDLLGAITG
jgi:cystathionine beta-synthase